MIATVEPPKGNAFRPVEPMPPEIRYRERKDACAVSLLFNGVMHMATLDLDGGGKARPGDVAAMLEKMAAEIRGGGR